MCLQGTGEELATRSATFTGDLGHTEALRVLYEGPFSFKESAKDERVGEGAKVGRRDSSEEGVGEGCVKRTKSSIWRDCETKPGKLIACWFSGCGIFVVGTTGEGGSVAPEKEEARFLDEQVLRVSGGLREVEDALARFWGGVREDGDGSDMVG